MAEKKIESSRSVNYRVFKGVPGGQVTYRQLRAMVARDTGLTVKEVDQFVEALRDALYGVVDGGGWTQLPGIGRIGATFTRMAPPRDMARGGRTEQGIGARDALTVKFSADRDWARRVRAETLGRYVNPARAEREKVWAMEARLAELRGEEGPPPDICGLDRLDNSAEARAERARQYQQRWHRRQEYIADLERELAEAEAMAAGDDDDWLGE